MKLAAFWSKFVPLVTAFILLCRQGSYCVDISLEDGFSKDEAESNDGTEPSKALSVGHPVSNRCSDLNLSLLDKGKACGSPLSSPCFDFSRCLPPPEGGGSTIYVYDDDCSLADSASLSVDGREPDDGKIIDDHRVAWYWRKVVKEAGLLAKTYDSACLFIHVSRAGNEPCATRAPLWNDGVNHVMVDFSDSSRDNRRTVANSFAMEAASNMHTCYYRSGYDISVPLVPERVFPDLADTAPLDRKFFLTVKGTVYLSGHGSEERMSLVPLHDEDDGVVASLHCLEREEQSEPENVAYCEDLSMRYDNHEYEALMNTTFALVPAGRSPGTYRLAEAMSAGAIPVFLARDIVRPFREQVDWSSFSFVFSPDQVPSLLKTLRAVSPEDLIKMQRKSLDMYSKMFGENTKDFTPIARKMVKVLLARLEHQR